MSQDQPMSELLSRCLAGLIACYSRAGAGIHPDPSVAMWRSLLCAATQAGDTEAELVERTSISRRALRTSVTGATRAGWVAAEPSGERGAGQVVRLTHAGVAAQDRWPRIQQTALTDWHNMVKPESSESLRLAATAVVAQLDLEWPHHPVTYGGSDPSITGGSYRVGTEGPPRVPAHGKDWRPVVRSSDRADIDTLPIDAVLAQLLCAFASDYEQERVGAIAVALMLAHAADTWVPVGEFPAEAAVTGEGKSLLERHGLVSLSIDPSVPLREGHQGELVQPSPAGRAIRDAYRPVTDKVEQQWRTRYGMRVVDGLRSALSVLETELPEYLPSYFVTSPVRT